LDKHPIPTTRDGNELADSPFGRALTEQMIDVVGDYKYVDNGCTQACRHLASLRKQSYFEDDVDAFERFVDERLEELNTYRQGDQRFPVAGLNDEPNFRRIDHRDHLLFTAGEEPNTFLDGLEIPITSYEPELEEMSPNQTVQTQFDVPIPEPDGPASYSPHSLMDDSVFEEVDDGRGIEFGSRLHEFAERYASGEDVDPQGDEQRRVRAFLDSMDGELRIEENAYLPLEVDGKQVTIHGIVDLVHVTDDTIEIIDYKTDRGRHAENEYRTQLSVYYHILVETYPQREITTSIFYTAEDTRVTISPVSKDELVKLLY
jgi:hypothetical protein